MADRHRLLARLERLRAAERREALARLAEARAEQARMEEVARRSQALAGESADAPDALIGAALSARLAFHARLAGLQREAERMSTQAHAAEARARSGFAEADRRHGRVRAQRNQAAHDADQLKLARALLNTVHKPRGPF